MRIEVKKKGGNEFIVTISKKGSETEHIITLDDKYYERLTQRKITKEKLIERSFAFLLKREPKESILSKFNLKLINSYFPEFEREMKGKIG